MNCNNFPRFHGGPEVLQGPLKAALANETESSESHASLSAVKRAEDSRVRAVGVTGSDCYIPLHSAEK